MRRFLRKLEIEADKKYMMYVLAISSFLESVIFPIPVDFLTLSLSSVHPKKWLRFSIVTTIFSILGALSAYFLGAYFFDLFGQHLIEMYGYQDHFKHVVDLFDRNTFVVMFTAAFTIIPFKVFTLTGGALKVAFVPFMLASILGRGLRFFSEAYLASKFGKRVTEHIMKKFNTYSLIVVILALLYFLIRKFYL